MVKEITDYLQQKLPENFKGWTREALEDYVVWHIERNQLLAVTNGGEVQGVLVGWPTEEMQVELFRWQEPTQHGRFWYWDQLAANTPETFMVGISEFLYRRPDAASLPSYGVRHGKVRSFRPVLKIYQKGQEIYGHKH